MPMKPQTPPHAISPALSPAPSEIGDLSSLSKEELIEASVFSAKMVKILESYFCRKAY